MSIVGKEANAFTGPLSQGISNEIFIYIISAHLDSNKDINLQRTYFVTPHSLNVLLFFSVCCHGLSLIKFRINSETINP
jgi:hypothetical protein